MHKVTTVLIPMCIVTLLAFWTRSWSIPSRIVVILEGESLLNGASGLVAL